MSERVSVVTPCHNAAAFVGETVECLVAQTHADVEHILVDDASQDGSWEVIQGWVARYPDRIRAIRVTENRGPAYARNRGVELSTGDYLMFLDADDVVTPETLAALVAAVRDRPLGVAFCECKALRQDGAGEWKIFPRDLPVPNEDTDLYRAFLEHSAWPPTCSTLWRRDAYDLAGEYDEAMVRDEDTDLLLRAHAAGAFLVRSAEGLGLYRAFDGSRVSVSSGISLARFQASMRVLEKLAGELERIGKLPAYTWLIGRSYRMAAMYGFQQGYWELARECLRQARRYGGPRTASSTTAGKLIERTLGLEGKERFARAIARLGVTTRTRRDALRLERALAAAERTG
ncbi:MAG TPA: glycosyltransferase [Longimicrobium sp.]